MCTEFQVSKDHPSNRAKPPTPASRVFDIAEFFLKIFVSLTFKIVPPAMLYLSYNIEWFPHSKSYYKVCFQIK